MTRNECADCHAFLLDGGTECPDCGLPAPLQPAIGASPAAPAVPAPASNDEAAPAPDLAPGMLPAKPAPVLAILATAALACWFVAYAVFGWRSYREGYQGLLVPTWNTAFAVWMLAVAVGVRSQQSWAWGWAMGIALVNGLMIAIYALRLGGELLWVGVAVHAVCLAAVRAAWGRVARAPASTIGKALGVLVLGTSLVIGLIADRQAPGSEHGRANFVAELQQAYDGAVPGRVQVQAAGRTLVIEAPEDTDAQIDQAADGMQAGLWKTGSNAKAWAVGFERVLIKNRTSERILLRGR